MKLFKKEYLALKSAATEINESKDLMLTYKEDKEQILSLIKLTSHKDGTFSYKMRPIAPPAPTESLKKTFNRPRAGSITGRVWEICDEFIERKKVFEIGLSEDINPGTIGQQFYCWNNRAES